jgi:hypothetical protein
MAPSAKPPAWFWIVGVLMLLWNGVGVMAYVGEAMMPAEALQALPEGQRALILGRPAWATAAYAVAVFGGVAGCLLLLIRRRSAIPVLSLSLLGVIVQMGHAFLLADAFRLVGPAGTVLPALVLAGAVFLVWFARHARAKGWLR